MCFNTWAVQKHATAPAFPRSSDRNASTAVIWVESVASRELIRSHPLASGAQGDEWRMGSLWPNGLSHVDNTAVPDPPLLISYVHSMLGEAPQSLLVSTGPFLPT